MDTQEFTEHTQQQQSFSEWAIVELFGHQRIAGLVTNATVGGCPFVRVDVPKRAEDGEGWMFTKLYGNGAIYAISITTKDAVLTAVEHLHPKPYVPRTPERAALPEHEPDGDFEEEFDDE